MSHAFLSDEWATFSEVLASSAEVASTSGPIVVPLLVEQCELPLRLDAKVSLSFIERESWEPAVARLRDFLALEAPSAEDLPCPFPGMAAFASSQRHLFFGRDAELNELAIRAGHQPLLVVLGPSGCGKSSLALAGLIPRLEHDEAQPWLVRVVQPGAAPFQSLRQALSASSLSDPGEALSCVNDLLDQQLPDTRLLLVVDRAEAVFAQSAGQEQSDFLEAISALRGGARSCLLLLMRADFFSDLMSSRLWPLSESERVELATLGREGLRQAIVRPAASVSVHVEPVLVERLLRDCAEEPGALPLLQETMVLLWRHRARRLLTLAAYEDIANGGESALSTALVLHADAALGALAAERQRTAKRVLLRLVQLGEGRGHTRRRQPVSALRNAGPDEADVEAVIQHLAQRRILTLGGPAEGSEAEADLAHESLIVRWPVLNRWIDEQRADEVRRRRLESDAEAWDGTGRDRDSLYRGHRLLEVKAWSDRHPGELSRTALGFLAAAGRRRRLIQAAVTVLAMGIVASLVAFAVPEYRDMRYRAEAIALSPNRVIEGGRLPALAGFPALEIPAMLVDEHEVTNAQYRLCVKADRCQAPRESAERLYSLGNPQLPVVDVSAEDASGYCAWVGRRLPTASEWLWAAIGSSGGPYPWGSSDPTRRHANSDTAGLVTVSDARFSKGKTPEGIGHLIGNAFEWTASVGHFGNVGVVVDHDWGGADTSASLVLIGASYAYPPLPAHQATSTAVATEHDAATGFRCVDAAE